MLGEIKLLGDLITLVQSVIESSFIKQVDLITGFSLLLIFTSCIQIMKARNKDYNGKLIILFLGLAVLASNVFLTSNAIRLIPDQPQPPSVGEIKVVIGTFYQDVSNNGVEDPMDLFSKNLKKLFSNGTTKASEVLNHYKEIQKKYRVTVTDFELLSGDTIKAFVSLKILLLNDTMANPIIENHLIRLLSIKNDTGRTWVIDEDNWTLA